jgi:hypothetical protein
MGIRVTCDTRFGVEQSRMQERPFPLRSRQERVRVRVQVSRPLPMLFARERNRITRGTGRNLELGSALRIATRGWRNDYRNASQREQKHDSGDGAQHSDDDDEYETRLPS